MSVVALVIAPSIALSADNVTEYTEQNAATEMVQEVQVDVNMEGNEDGTFTATITTTTTKNGEESKTIEEITGTEEEIKAELEEKHEGSSGGKKIEIKKVIEKK
jgi:K(+)-stimulated pyrophosphate-energized sodium pump